MQLPQSLSALDSLLSEVDHEFKTYLSDLSLNKGTLHENLKTFSPLDAVLDFEQRGIQAVPELRASEMMGNDQAFKKLLANMMFQCRPGSITEDDLEQLSGINGREMGSRVL